jgi:hypothetical protein
MNKIKHCKHGKTNFVYCVDCKVEHLEEALEEIQALIASYELQPFDDIRSLIKEVRGECSTKPKTS